ncbi:hypothetical protein PAV_141p00430 (plasmid) [Paenibacillus alvei DSM 29]|nr:hypothetical protein PAV_141p00430 [Paenibacillus alvei DSM 29]
MKRKWKKRISEFMYYIMVVQIFCGIHYPPAILEESRDYAPHPKVVRRK